MPRNPVYKVKVKTLRRYWTPDVEFGLRYWKEIRRKIKCGVYSMPPDDDFLHWDQREYDLRSIAWHVANGITKPILLHITDPDKLKYGNRAKIIPSGLGYNYTFRVVTLLNGNHRFAASIMRGDEFILVRPLGCMEQFHKLFKPIEV